MQGFDAPISGGGATASFDFVGSVVTGQKRYREVQRSHRMRTFSVVASPTKASSIQRSATAANAESM
jgi:hypothetical protein